MPRENLPRRVWNRQNKYTYNYCLAALVKGKCSSTKPTPLATGVVCHPDSQQNRPYKIPWPCWELNRGPTAPQARTLPVCHTTPTTAMLILMLHLGIMILTGGSVVQRFMGLPRTRKGFGSTPSRDAC